MKRRKYIIWTLILLFVFGVAIPVGVAYAARPSIVLPDEGLLQDGLSYPYQRSTFYDQQNDYNWVFFVENYFLKLNSSHYGEEWANGWTYSVCSGSRNFSIFYDGNYTHIAYVNTSTPTLSAVYYGAIETNTTGGIAPLASPEPVARATVGCRVIEPMVMVDSFKTYVVMVWTQECPLNPPVLPRYAVYASVGSYSVSGHWTVTIEPTNELTGLTNSRYVSATRRYDVDNSIYIIHAENMSGPTVKEDSWYLVGNNFNGTSGLFEADQWIMDAVTPTDRMLYGYFYSTNSIWDKPEIQQESIHVVYTQDDDQSLSGRYLTTHDWNENDGETWGVHTKNITLPALGSIQYPALARLNETALRYLAAENVTALLTPEQHWRDFHTFTQTWSDPVVLRTLNWGEIDYQQQIAWNASSPLGYDYADVQDSDVPILYDWFGDQEAIEAGALGAEILQLVLPILMAILALLATLYVGIRLSTEPKVTIIVAMLSCALVGAIAFLVVKQIVGGL